MEDARLCVQLHTSIRGPSGNSKEIVVAHNSALVAHAPSGSPLADMIRRLLYAHPDKLLKKEAEALLHKHYYDTRSAADQELSEGIAKLGEEAIGSVASQEAAQPCHKATEYHLIAGASQYACMLQKGHKGKCQPGGTCVMHGPYIGLHNGLVQCPQWPLCIEIPKVAAGTPAKE